jgi:Tol biopolymer transport system component
MPRSGHRGIRRAGIALSICLVPLAYAVPANASQEGTHIVWSHLVDADFSAAQIVIAGPHGAHLRVLTHPGTNIYDGDPVLSPDGSQVLFNRENGNTGKDTPMLVNVAGGPAKALDFGCVDPCAADVMPNWTPEGKHVVFTRVVGPFDLPGETARSAVLWVADLDGKHAHRLSQPGIDGTFEDYKARYAPGGYFTFVRARNFTEGIAVFRANNDGSNVRQLTPWSLQADLPDVSLATSGPTKNLVVFETYGHGPPEGLASAVATVPATCTSVADCTTKIHYLTSQHSAPVQHFNPSWSPDGQRIAYTTFTPRPTGEIVTMNWDGSDRHLVSRSRFFDFRPDWGT